MIPPSESMLYYAVASASGILHQYAVNLWFHLGVLLTLGLAVPALYRSKKAKTIR